MESSEHPEFSILGWPCSGVFCRLHPTLTLCGLANFEQLSFLIYEMWILIESSCQACHDAYKRSHIENVGLVPKEVGANNAIMLAGVMMMMMVNIRVKGLLVTLCLFLPLWLTVVPKLCLTLLKKKKVFALEDDPAPSCLLAGPSALWSSQLEDS